jgi:hypothetical protein
VREWPLATTIERDILPETMDIDGVAVVPPDRPDDGGPAREVVSDGART